MRGKVVVWLLRGVVVSSRSFSFVREREGMERRRKGMHLDHPWHVLKLLRCVGSGVQTASKAFPRGFRG